MAVLHENDVILIDSKKISYGKLSANGSPPAKGPRSDNRRDLRLAKPALSQLSYVPL